MSSIEALQVKAAVQCGCYSTAEIIQRRQVAGIRPFTDSEFRERMGAELTSIAMIEDHELVERQRREASLLRKAGR